VQHLGVGRALGYVLERFEGGRLPYQLLHGELGETAGAVLGQARPESLRWRSLTLSVGQVARKTGFLGLV